MRLTVEDARKLGITVPDKPKKSGKTVDKRKSITDYIRTIQTSTVSIERRNGGGYKINIEGLAPPSLNTVLGWDKKTVYPSYNKAWRARMYDASREHGMHRERSKVKHTLFIVMRRKYLIDYDNTFVKQIIDGLRYCGLIADDDPRYIDGYSVHQQKAKKDGVTMYLVPVDSERVQKIKEIEELIYEC